MTGIGQQRNMFLMFTDKEHAAVVYIVDGYEGGGWNEG